jgi:hypothetical protein
MKDKTKIALVSTEIAGLWTTYITDSLGACMVKHFLRRLEDEEVRPVLELALNISNGHLQVIKDKFNQEGIQVPKGFTDEDINLNAPRLYTDSFYLFFLMNVAQNNMNNFTLILNHIARKDIREFFSNCISESVKLFNMATDTLEQQGLYIKAPRVEFNTDIDFIDNQSFFSSGIFHKKRPLNATEITCIFTGMRQNIVGKALITGFGQVAESKKISEYLFRGRDVARDKVERLSIFFREEEIPLPSTSDSFVTSSTIAPFSEKLMLNLVVMLFAASIAQDGIGLANTMRHDLQSYFSGSMLETGTYAEDGLDLIIKNKWLEHPPVAIVHKDLARC